MEFRLLAKNKQENRLKINKDLIANSGAIKTLIRALRMGTPTARENSAYNKITIGQSGDVPYLVHLLENGGFRGKKDASTALFTLCKTAVVEEGGIPVLVEIVEVGLQRQKEIASVILLQICEDSMVYRTMVAREGAIPPLIALSQSGTTKAKQKSMIVDALRQSLGRYGGDFGEGWSRLDGVAWAKALCIAEL
ncbi:hypothetical protein MKX03_036021 [Papaver bracteatum]|nr:hypothetical protein MKX03_036021 [Papaver bracteatum]